MKTTLRIARAGFGDGWREPHDLSTSTNIDWLLGRDATLQEEIEFERWLNIGQFARAGFRSQPWREGFWPFAWRHKK